MAAMLEVANMAAPRGARLSAHQKSNQFDMGDPLVQIWCFWKNLKPKYP